MRLHPSLLLSAAAIALLAVPAISAPLSPQAAVTAALALQNRAAENKDINAFMSTLSPNFVGTDTNGSRLTKSGVRQNMLILFKEATHIAGVTTIIKFLINDGRAFVTTKDSDAITAEDPKTHRTATTYDDDVNYSVWSNHGGVWTEDSEDAVSENTNTQPGTQLDAHPGQTT